MLIGNSYKNIIDILYIKGERKREEKRREEKKTFGGSSFQGTTPP